jgi:hypothetical protein
MHFARAITGSLLLTAMIASSLAQGRKPTDEDRNLARQVLAEAVQEAVKLPDYSNKELFGSIAELQATADDFDSFLVTVKLADPFVTEAICTAAKRLTGHNKVDSALVLASNIKQDSRPTLFYCIAEQLANEGENRRALEMAQKISSPEVKVEALALLSQKYGEAGDSVTADKLWKEGARLDRQNSGRAKSNNDQVPRAASAVNKDMAGVLRDAAKTKDLEERLIFLAEVAASKKEKGDSETSRLLLKRTQEIAARLPASEEGDVARHVYAGLLAKEQEFDAAKAVIGQMIQGTEGQLKVLSTLAVFQAEAGMDQEASQTASMILQQPVPKVRNAESHAEQRPWLFQTTMERIAIAQVNRGDAQRALQTLSDLDKAGIEDTLNEKLLAITYAKGRTGDFEGATQALATSGQKAFLSNPVKEGLQVLAAEMVAAGKTDAALQWARKQQPTEAKVMVLVGVAQGLLGLEGIPNSEFYMD